MSTKILHISCFIFLMGCGLVAQPKWFGEELSAYPPSGYFIGEGVGSDYSKALANAQTEIASQIRVGIESRLTLSISEVSDNDKSELRESFDSEIKTSVNETIQGIVIVKKEKKKKQYYVAAALDKGKYLAGLRVEIDQLWNQINRLITDAREFKNNGKLFSAIDNYSDAMPYIAPFYVKKSFYDSLSDKPYTIAEFITVDGIISEIRKLINKIDLNIVEGNNQTGRSGSFLQKPIIIEAKFGKKDYPISSLPLKIEYDDGSTDKIITDASGRSEVWAMAFCGDANKGKVQIQLDHYKFPSVYKKYFVNVNTQSKYNCTEKMPISFSVYVEDEEKNRLEKVEQKLSKSLEKIGYTVFNDADLALNGSVSVIEENEIQGKSGPMVQLKAELSLLMVAKSTNETVGSFTSNFVGLGKNKNKSLEKAYNKMKIKDKDLTQALSSSEEILRNILTKKSIQFLEEGQKLYQQTKLDDAIGILAQVSYGNEQINEAQKLIASIKKEQEEKLAEQLRREEEEKEKERLKEIELTRIEAEKEMALAESRAKEKESEARIAEAQAAMEKAKADLANIEKEKLQAEASIAESEAEAERARADAIAAVLNKADNMSDASSPSLDNSLPLNSNEKKIVNTWQYIGSLLNSTGTYSFEGSGRILFINEDRTFTEGISSGSWSANGDNLYLDGFSVPYTIEGNTLILGFEINKELNLMMYELL